MIVSGKNISAAFPTPLVSTIKLRVSAEVADLRAIELPFGTNYYDGFDQEVAPPMRMKLGEYLDEPQAPGLMCPEYPLPDEVAKKIKLEVGGAPVAGVALVHAGKAGSIAPLHFDWDHRWVLHTCLKGRKTFYFFPPEAGWLLAPVINTSALCIPRLARADADHLVRVLGGQKVELEPGKAVLFPSMWWHCVRYEEDSVSLSLRFEERADLRPLSVLPRSWWLQRLVWKVFKGNVPAGDLVCSCAAKFFSSFSSWQERYESFAAHCRALLVEMGEERGSRYWTGDNFNFEKGLAEFELEGLYTLPAQELAPEQAGAPKDYIFGALDKLPGPLKEAMATYAVLKRKGLPPARGLIGTA